MKPCRYSRVIGVGICICALTFHFATAALAQENVAPVPYQQNSQTNQSQKAKNKSVARAPAINKNNQTNTSTLRQSQQRRENTQSPRQQEYRHRDSGREKAALIATGIDVVLSAIRKPAPKPEPASKQAVEEVKPVSSSARKTHSRAQSHHKSAEPDLWSKIDPLKKDIPESARPNDTKNEDILNNEQFE